MYQTSIKLEKIVIPKNRVFSQRPFIFVKKGQAIRFNSAARKLLQLTEGDKISFFGNMQKSEIYISKNPNGDYLLRLSRGAFRFNCIWLVNKLVQENNRNYFYLSTQPEVINKNEYYFINTLAEFNE